MTIALRLNLWRTCRLYIRNCTVVNQALYSSELGNDYHFEMERTERMRNIAYMQAVN